MGEAKRRKAAAAQDGSKPSHEQIKSNGRGLVVSPPIEVDGNQLLTKSSNLDSQELRVATLLWDRLVWPTSRAIYFVSGPDEEFLEQAGILSRPDYTVWGDAAQGFVS